MTLTYLIKVATVACLLLQSCKKGEPAASSTYPEKYPVTTGFVDETSGIADSRTNPGYLWVIQDSRRPAEIALLSHKGIADRKIFIKNVTNRDWEDMLLGKGPDPAKNYIYIGDLGDNYLIRSEYYFYRFPEPSGSSDSVYDAERVRFRYADGPHDAEAFLQDGLSGDLFIFTKEQGETGVYRLQISQNAAELQTATLVTKLALNNVVSAAMKPDQTGFALKTYTALQYYRKQTGETLEDALGRPFETLPYEIEPQGEAVCFTLDSKGYFTLSEKGLADLTLNYYRK